MHYQCTTCIPHDKCDDDDDDDDDEYQEKERKASTGYTPHSLVYVAGYVKVRWIRLHCSMFDSNHHVRFLLILVLDLLLLLKLTQRMNPTFSLRHRAHEDSELTLPSKPNETQHGPDLKRSLPTLHCPSASLQSKVHSYSAQWLVYPHVITHTR
jgi:hypothetical protein